MSRRMLIARLFVVSSLALPLAACATARSEPPRVVAPPLQTYSPEFQRKAADQLDAICDQAAEVCQMVDDYGALRDAVRKLPQ